MTPAQIRRIHASADFCFDRDWLAEQLVKSAFLAGSALLFGARQSGKTTLLRYMVKRFAPTGLVAGEINDVDLLVYVDLMQMPFDARPGDFFRLLAGLALCACRSHLPGFDESKIQPVAGDERDMLSHFSSRMQDLFAAGGETRLRFLFLLDESKRILGDRFPRGFQDNLFAILYGDELKVCDRISFLFAGAQDLYDFCEDETSPIGSRASFHFLRNLSVGGIAQMMSAAGVKLAEAELLVVAARIHEQTGGHAGLSTRVVEQLVSSDLPIDSKGVEAAVDLVFLRCAQLFRLWTLALSIEARAIQPMFAKQRLLGTGDIAQALHTRGYDRFAADRVFQEWEFTGIARIENHQALLVNEIYWRYFLVFVSEDTETPPERAIWNTIEELELLCRSIIVKEYEANWPGKAIHHIKRILGPDNCKKIEAIQAKSTNAFPYSPNKVERDLMECMYIGQLVELMIAGDAWHLFKGSFRDKRHLQDLFAAISPVRNERAHFASVPEKELTRCRIACDDLLVIFRKDFVESEIA